MQHTSASRAFTHDGSRRLISLTEEPARCLADARSYVVKTLEASERERWNEYVRVHREATFFHRAEWGEVLARAFGHRSRYLYAESGGRIAGVLPLVEVKSLLFGHALVSTPFCVYGGCLADEEGASRALEDAACELGRELGVDYIEMRNRKPRNRGWLTKDLYVTFRRPIDPDPERNMLAIPRKQRAMVRKGIQKQLRAEIDSGTERAYHLYAESLRNLGTPVFSRRYMALLKETFARAMRSRHRRSRGPARRERAEFLLPRRGPALLRRGGGRRPRCRRQRLHVLAGDGARPGARREDLRFWPQQARHRVVRVQDSLGFRAGTPQLTSIC